MYLGIPKLMKSPQEQAVAYTDGYGNLKTTWDAPPAPTGSVVRVRIGDVEAPATVSDGVFEVPAGTMSFAPGSSGRPGRPFYELLARGGSAARTFAHPRSGTPVEIVG